VATNFLKQIKPGMDAKLYAFLRTSVFRQPSDPRTPLVMIAGGSGIAPLRGFLRERLFHKKGMGLQYGPAYLFFGVRTPGDLAYSELISECLANHVLTEAHLSFSSKPAQGESYTPKFVSEDVRASGKTIWRALSDGGFLYLCGGASAFAESCTKALKEVFQVEGKLDAQGADDYFASLIRQKRYLEDLAD